MFKYRNPCVVINPTTSALGWGQRGLYMVYFYF